ncbi:arabinose efflux permease [Cupriavidus basilensis OR16]|uniref:Arabinose efflux permease n=1 Tax=Cupriavidus basilensis OR16 TaxID=1127483 RepID=H1S787_9BURK|nr:arabinose efflux permease [Cupriavidus basilensis OR16]
MLVSGYAIGVAVGAPILAILTNKWPRKTALVGLMGLFIVGNALCALAPNYALLMAARVVTAFCHAAFFGIGAVVAAELVPREKRAQAVALMFTGLTVANVLGVPFGTAFGHLMGWRSTFWAVTVIGVAAAAALVAWLPKAIPMQAGSILREFRSIGAAQVQLALLISTLASVSMFTVFTYIAYILRDVTGFTAQQESMVLLLFGAGITVGGLAGGKLADWKLMPALASLLAAVAVVQLVFSWTSHFPVPTLFTLFVWGMVSFAVVFRRGPSGCRMLPATFLRAPHGLRTHPPTHPPRHRALAHPRARSGLHPRAWQGTRHAFRHGAGVCRWPQPLRGRRRGAVFHPEHLQAVCLHAGVPAAGRGPMAACGARALRQCLQLAGATGVRARQAAQSVYQCRRAGGDRRAVQPLRAGRNRDGAVPAPAQRQPGDRLRPARGPVRARARGPQSRHGVFHEGLWPA